MTTLEDFRRALNANPEHTDLLLVFADWCDENGVPYGDGYRALGELRLRPWVGTAPRSAWSHAGNDHMMHRDSWCCLPTRWFLRIPDARSAADTDVKYWRYAADPFAAFETAAAAFYACGPLSSPNEVPQ